MLDAQESEELRSLQALAYGRDAALSDLDAMRLRELEERRFARSAEGAQGATTAPDAAESTETAPEGGRDTWVTDADDRVPTAGAGGSADQEADAEESAAPAASARASLLAAVRTHWRPVAFAVAAVLAIGVGVGWIAFGRSTATPIELTAEQQDWQHALISDGLYDSGSVRALAVEEGVVVWTATKNHRERTCLILGTGEITVPTCERTEIVTETGTYGAITVKGDGDVDRQVGAQMLFTASGEPAVAVSVYDYDPGESGITYANEEESNIAKRLTEDGYEAGSLWVVGYDGDVPVWSAVEAETQNHCLIYDGSIDDAPVTCADPETMQEQSSSLVLTVVDSATGSMTNLEMPSNSGPGYLVITREGGMAGAGGD